MKDQMEPALEGKQRSSNIALGVLGGMLMALGLSLIALAIYLSRGPGPFLRSGVTVYQVLGSYWVGGVLGGLAVGWLLPYTTKRIGSVFVGIIGMVPVLLALTYATEGPLARWSSDDWWINAIVALILGGPLGYQFLYHNERSHKEPTSGTPKES